MLALGAETYPGGDPEVFNMAVMGMRLAQRVNGVSLLHGQVSREMFAGLWPGFDTREVPIGSVTNGVHTPTWVASEVAALTSGDDPWERAAADFAGRMDDSSQSYGMEQLLRMLGANGVRGLPAKPDTQIREQRTGTNAAAGDSGYSPLSSAGQGPGPGRGRLPC